MPKINVLVIPSDTSGVSRYRSINPHLHLQKMYPDDFHVDIEYNVNYNNLDQFKNYQIIAYHRSIGPDLDQSIPLIGKLKSLGIKTVCDIDDYWMPGKEHPIHDIIKFNKINEKIVANLKHSEFVTTTTPIFANEIKNFNRNVVVFPNAIDPKEPQFNEPTLSSDRLRIGWLGGSSHLHDLQILDQSFSKLSSHKNDLQFVLCGFDTRGVVTEINQTTGEHKKRNILPQETVWAKYEQIFTQNYSIVSEDYKNYLLSYTQDPYDSVESLPYIREWTKPVTSYAKNYSKFDVSLAPIKNTIFNRMKSQLKVIEAGFYKKAIIASDLGPYQIDLTHCLKNGTFVDGNAILVNESRNHADWAKFIKILMNNRNMVFDMGQRLFETVNSKYHLDIVTNNRSSFYKKITE